MIFPIWDVCDGARNEKKYIIREDDVCARVVFFVFHVLTKKNIRQQLSSVLHLSEYAIGK